MSRIDRFLSSFLLIGNFISAINIYSNPIIHAYVWIVLFINVVVASFMIVLLTDKK